MINKYVAMGLGALIALAPVAASGQHLHQEPHGIAQDAQDLDPHGQDEDDGSSEELISETRACGGVNEMRRGPCDSGPLRLLDGTRADAANEPQRQ